LLGHLLPRNFFFFFFAFCCLLILPISSLLQAKSCVVVQPFP